MKDLQYFPDEIREKIDELYPPPPKPEKSEEKDELEIMTADEVFAKFAKKTRSGSQDSDVSLDENMKMAKKKMKIEKQKSVVAVVEGGGAAGEAAGSAANGGPEAMDAAAGGGADGGAVGAEDEVMGKKSNF